MALLLDEDFKVESALQSKIPKFHKGYKDNKYPECNNTCIEKTIEVTGYKRELVKEIVGFYESCISSWMEESKLIRIPWVGIFHLKTCTYVKPYERVEPFKNLIGNDNAVFPA